MEYNLDRIHDCFRDYPHNHRVQGRTTYIAHCLAAYIILLEDEPKSCTIPLVFNNLSAVDIFMRFTALEVLESYGIRMCKIVNDTPFVWNDIRFVDFKSRLRFVTVQDKTPTQLYWEFATISRDLNKLNDVF